MKIEAGQTYRFFSTVQLIDGNGIYPCLYTGRDCVALRLAGPDENDPENEAMWHVRFEDGAETSVYEGEIDNYYRDTAQYHGAFAVEIHASDKPADYPINNRAARRD
jgi:hypothetical protein